MSVLCLTRLTRSLCALTLPGLTDIVQNHKFVGIVDYDLSLSAVQHSTKLYLVNHAAIAYVASSHVPVQPQLL